MVGPGVSDTLLSDVPSTSSIRAGPGPAPDVVNPDAMNVVRAQATPTVTVTVRATGVMVAPVSIVDTTGVGMRASALTSVTMTVVRPELTTGLGMTAVGVSALGVMKALAPVANDADGKEAVATTAVGVTVVPVPAVTVGVGVVVVTWRATPFMPPVTVGVSIVAVGVSADGSGDSGGSGMVAWTTRATGWTLAFWTGPGSAKGTGPICGLKATVCSLANGS